MEHPENLFWTFNKQSFPYLLGRNSSMIAWFLKPVHFDGLPVPLPLSIYALKYAYVYWWNSKNDVQIGSDSRHQLLFTSSQMVH